MRRGDRAGLATSRARPSQRVAPLASTTIRAVIGPAAVSSPSSIPSRISAPVTAQGCRTSTPSSRARVSRSASKSARQSLKAAPRSACIAAERFEATRAAPLDPDACMARADRPEPSDRRPRVAGAAARCPDAPSRPAGRDRAARARIGSTLSPRVAQAIAAALPAGPPPTTTTSASTGRRSMPHCRAGSTPYCRIHRRTPVPACPRRRCACRPGRGSACPTDRHGKNSAADPKA